MKIVIEKIGDNVGVSFIGKGQRIDRLMLLTVALIETFVDSRIPDLTDEQLQQAAFLSKLFNLRSGKKKGPARAPTRTSPKRTRTVFSPQSIP